MSKQWDRARVIREIKDRRQAGQSLSCVWRDWPGLYRAAQRYCGSWRQAVIAAGLEPRRYRRWSRERVIQAVQDWHSAAPSEVDDWDTGLVSTASRIFGSWKQALQAAGLEPRRHRKWNRQRVIQAIQDRHVNGCSINGIEHRNRSLVRAARHYFGGWRQALEAAGLGGHFQIKKAPRPWSRAFIVAEIQALQEQQKSLGKVWREDPTLYSVAKREFGSWRAAVTAAGFQPVSKRWSKQLIISEIRDLRSPNSATPENNNLVAAAARYFGSWRKAVAAASATS